MSSNTLNDRTLDQLYEEVIDHMKRSGAFDEFRVGLIEPIWSDKNFGQIVEKFEYECKKFCEEVDLNQTRNALRTKLASHFDRYSTSRNMVKDHISRLLKERDEELRNQYYKHAEAFLKKFLPPPPQDSHQDLPGEIDMELESINDVDEDVDDDDEDDEVERPAYSPIGNDQELSMSPDLMDKIKNDTPRNVHQNEVDQQASVEDIKQKELIDSIPIDEIPEPPPIEENSIVTNMPSLEDIPQPPDEYSDELEKLTFSSVSSVNTAELSDFDNSIKLSDDEANIVGKPKNSKVSIEEVQGQINDLQTTNIECKQTIKIESMEPVEASESDGGCSENAATGRRVTRTRKSNPRYNNEHYKLL